MSWGQMNNKGLGPCSRRGLLAYVYNGVSDRMNALVAGNGSYIVRPCGHDLHGPTRSPYFQSLLNLLNVFEITYSAQKNNLNVMLIMRVFLHGGLI